MARGGAAGSGPVWVFDLDNTLHDADHRIFPHINRSMTAYLMEHLGVDAERAGVLRVDYWRRYGATLLGLMRHHDVDPDHFLAQTHHFPELPSMVRSHPCLREVLRRLPGRKLVFSNAPVHYSRAVLDVLGLHGVVEGVFSIEHTGYQPKPDPRGFRRLIRRYRLSPRRCIMVEDSVENLRTAKRMGMRTVWISNTPGRPAFVDLKLRSAVDLPRYLVQLRGGRGMA